MDNSWRCRCSSFTFALLDRKIIFILALSIISSKCPILVMFFLFQKQPLLICLSIYLFIHLICEDFSCESYCSKNEVDLSCGDCCDNGISSLNTFLGMKQCVTVFIVFSCYLIS